jgi:hypothetical protein
VAAALEEIWRRNKRSKWVGHEHTLKGVRLPSLLAYNLVKLNEGEARSIFHTSAPRFVQKYAVYSPNQINVVLVIGGQQRETSFLRWCVWVWWDQKKGESSGPSWLHNGSQRVPVLLKNLVKQCRKENDWVGKLSRWARVALGRIHEPVRDAASISKPENILGSAGDKS